MLLAAARGPWAQAREAGRWEMAHAWPRVLPGFAVDVFNMFIFNSSG